MGGGTVSVLWFLVYFHWSSIHCVTSQLISGGVLACQHHGDSSELESPEGGEDCAEAGGGGRPDEGKVDVEARNDRGDEAVTETDDGRGQKEDRELEAVHGEARNSEM